MSASVLIPKFVYRPSVVTITLSSNDQFVFTIGGGNLTATLTAGTYPWGVLTKHIKAALEAADATGTYTVTYSQSTMKYTLVRSSGTFTLDVGASARDALPTLGFTADKTGALTYTSDSAVPAETTITCTRRLRYIDLSDECEREDYEAASGRRESSLMARAERITFTLEAESTTVHGYLKEMWRNSGRHGGSIDFYPDSTTSPYITVYWDQKRFPMTEMVRSRNLYRHYEGEFAFRVKIPLAGTLTPADFDDRRPSS